MHYELTTSAAVVGLIGPAYVEHIWCVCELGATLGLGLQRIPPAQGAITTRDFESGYVDLQGGHLGYLAPQGRPPLNTYSAPLRGYIAGVSICSTEAPFESGPPESWQGEVTCTCPGPSVALSI